MNRVLITGATGFLGHACAHEMRRGGWDVLTTGRNLEKGNKLQAEGFAFVPCDLATERDGLAQLMAGTSAVIHSAALSSPWGSRQSFHRANVTGTQNIVDACIQAGVARLVHISSPSVAFSFKPQHQAKEDAPWECPPPNHYIATKREAERIALGASVSTIALRPKALIGPGDTTIIPRVMKVARRGEFPLIGEGDVPLSLTWVGDAAAAARLAAEAPDRCAGKVYNITGGEPVPRSAALRKLFEAAKIQVTFRVIPLRTAMICASFMESASRIFTLGKWEPPLTRYSVAELGLGQTLDITAAKSDLGYQPTKNLLEALSDCGRAWVERQQSP